MQRLLGDFSVMLPSEEDVLHLGATVSFHRLLCFLGTLLTPLLAVAYAGPNSSVVLWTGVGVTVVSVGLLVASYRVPEIRRHLKGWTRGLLFLHLSWIVSGVALSGFGEGYAVGLLLAFVVFTGGVGLGAESLGPVLWFAGSGLAITAVSAAFAPPSQGTPLFLLGCMATAAVGEAILIKRVILAGEGPQPDDVSLPSVTESVSTGLFRVVPERGLVYANRAFADMLGYGSVGEVLCMDPETVYADADERSRFWSEARREGSFEGAEVTLKRKDGSTFPALLNGSIAYDKDGDIEYYDGAVVGLTEWKRREEERRREKVERARAASASRVAEMAERTDYETTDHIERVGAIARVIAEALDKPRAWQKQIEQAAPFHDVGKIAVTDQILTKQGPLSDAEREKMEEHAAIGPDLLPDGSSDLLEMARRIARSHHERWDGEGYPDGLKGDEIPLSARIVAVADALDAMTHERPYRDALSPDEAFTVIEEKAGTQFCPTVSAAALSSREFLLDLI